MLTTSPFSSIPSLDAADLSTVVGGCHKKATATATAVCAPCACSQASATATAVAAPPPPPQDLVSTNVSISGY